ncbi:maltase A1-like [Planococcus citri]|uniref:maltase A1-like n=1 Tax=Planococcus citri TaxID=170843 RepID=UPI0031F91A5D
MKFWLEKGVSGFRVDAPMLFMEDEQLRDNPPPKLDANIFTVFGECERTLNHPDTFRFINELNVFLQQYDRKSRKKIQLETVMKYYGTKRFPVFNLPLNYRFVGLAGYLDAYQLRDFLRAWLDKVPKNMHINWALGNHDFGRVAHYFNTEYNSILLALVTMLPGTLVIYFGEELTMGANNLVINDDIYLRNPHRSPMHWDDTRNAGFTSGEKSWLPVHPNYWHYNVQTQKTYENSSLNYFKDLTSLRKTDTVKYGDLKFHIVSKWVMAYSRTYKGTSYIVVMNLGTETQPIDLYDATNNISTTLTVVACSPNSGYKKGYEMKTTPNYPTASLLRPHSVVVLSSM